MAEALLKTVVDYQSEEHHLQLKWNNPANKKNKSIGLKGMQRADPRAILFNLNEDIQEVEESKS